MHKALFVPVLLFLTFALPVNAQNPGISVSDALEHPQILIHRAVNLMGGLVIKERKVTTRGVLHTIFWITAPEQIFSAVQNKPTKFIVVAVIGQSNIRKLSIVDIRRTRLGNVVNGKQATFYNMVRGILLVRR